MFSDDEQFDYNFDDQKPLPMTFGQQIRGATKIALIFTGGLTWALVGRSFQLIAPVFNLSLGLGAIAAILGIALCKSNERRLILVLSGLILAGVICGSWDGIYAWMLDAQSQYEGLKVLVVIGTIGAAIAVDRLWRREDG